MPTVQTTERLLRGLVEAAPDAMLGVSRSGTILVVNGQAEELFGFPRDEMIGRPIELLLPERFRDRHVQDRSRYIENPSVRPMGNGRGLSARRKDGREVAVDIMLSPVKDQSEIAVIATVRDATERRLADQKLATSEAMFRALYDQAPDAIVAVNREGKIVQTNRMVESMFGYEPNELLQRSIEVLIPERFRGKHVAQRKGFFEAPRSRSMGQGRELCAQRKDGAEFPVDIMLSPVQVPGSEVAISVIRDVTERMRAERALKEHAEKLSRSNQELEQFAYVASHDLQEPLRAVAASCQVMQKRLAGKFDEDTNEYVQFAIDGAKRMQELINDLLSYSRITRETRELEPLDLERVRERVQTNLVTQIQDTRAEIAWAELPTIRGDFSQLVQLFQNLLSNAMKFRGEAAPRIVVDVASEGPNWRISVRDNGIGIAPEYQEKIFVIFQRLHRREEYPGTGIGLAICKKIVERHGGRIGIESRPGEGSTFHFTFPKLEAAHGA